MYAKTCTLSRCVSLARIHCDDLNTQLFIFFLIDQCNDYSSCLTRSSQPEVRLLPLFQNLLNHALVVAYGGRRSYRLVFGFTIASRCF